MILTRILAVVLLLAPAPTFAQASLGTAPRNLPAATVPSGTDSIVCDPTPGRAKRCTPAQIVTAGGSPTASAAGMVSGGADNANNVAALNTLLSAPSGSRAGYSVRFTQDPTLGVTSYYFSRALDLRRSGIVSCDGSGVAGHPGVDLVFAAGVDGPVFESNTTSSDGGLGGGEINNCGIKSLGYGSGDPARGSADITNVTMTSVDGIPAPMFAVGDGIIAVQKFLRSSPTATLATLPGATVGSVSGTTVTLASPQVVNADTSRSSTTNLALYRLPAALADTISTTAGSNTVTVTGGTTKFLPGDLIWSARFPFWSRVGTATGAAGAQTLTIYDQFLVNAVSAVATGTGSPIWRVPAGIRRLETSATNSDTVAYFPVGLDMPCATFGGINCTSSKDSGDFIFLTIAGRATAGDNTGASTDFGSLFADNYYTDIIEGGTIGSAYVGTNSNSGESNSLQPIVGNCANQNYSTFTGVYAGSTSTGWDYCLNTGTGPAFIQPQAGSPHDGMKLGTNTLTPQSNGPFRLEQNVQASITAASYDSATGNVRLTLSKALPINVGDSVQVSDLWGQGDPRANVQGTRTATAGTSGTMLDFTVAAGLRGLMISGGNVSLNVTLPCVVLNGVAGTVMQFTNDCVTEAQLLNFSFTSNNALDIVGDNLDTRHLLRFTFPSYTGYIGDGNTYPALPRGVLIGDIPNERLLDNAASAPSNRWNLQGDFYLNRAPVAGGTLGWSDTSAGTNMHPAGLVANDNGGVSWNLGEIVSTGTEPNFAGTCTIGSATGGASAGSFITPSACVAGTTVILTFAVAAPHGWACAASDETEHTPIAATADDAASCTLYMPGTTARDKLTWQAKGY